MIKKRLLSLLVLLAAVVTGAVAQDPWTSGDCTVTLSGDVLTVSGTGAMANYADSYDLPWDGYRYDIKTIVIESGVTSIGNSAFAKCYNLESVSIPASVTSIGSFAFEDCGSDVEALTVSFAEGSTPLTISEYAFNYAKLKSIDIPKRMTSIGNCAFSGCNFLESVSIPASVTSIGDFAFQRCGEYAEALTVSFAEGSTLESIGEYAFIESALKSIDIPNSVTSIGERAFSGCSKLESVSIPASVTSIGVAAFSPCYMLAKVNIYASSLTTYGADAFKDNATGRKIYVLPTAVDTYKAGWPDYADDIEAMTVYATSVKEGTEDAANWTTTPSQAEEGQTVTINYAGTKSVKSVTAKRKITTGNIMVYFTDAQNWGDVNVYYWNDGSEWPGTAMTYVETNEYSQKIYRAEIPATAVGIIFNGNGNQTVDITENIADGSWWYTTDELEGANNKVGYVGKYTENIVVTNVDDNKWTFTQPDGNVELDIEYYPAYSVTISDGDVDATNWSATPTEQSVGKNVTLQYTGRKKIKRITIEAVPGPVQMEFVEFTDGINTVKFANMNLGATSVADGTSSYGDFYAWAATEPFGTVSYTAYNAGTVTATKEGGYSEANTPYRSGTSTFSKYTSHGAILEAMDDAATAKMGEGYRMPTMDDFSTLCAACGGTDAEIYISSIATGAAYAKGIYWVAGAETAVTVGGDEYKTNGVLFVQDADHHIFFPMAGLINENNEFVYDGYYWSSTMNTDTYSNDYDSAHYMYLCQYYVGHGNQFYTERKYGFPIRPVKE